MDDDYMDNDRDDHDEEGEGLMEKKPVISRVSKDRSLFGMESNYTFKEVVVNFFSCKGLQIRKIEGEKLESPIFRFVYLIFVIVMVVVQVFLRTWNLFTMVVNSEKANAGFWVFYALYSILTVVTLVFLILPLLIYETRMFFLGFSLCCTSCSCIFGIAEIVILAFVITSDSWAILLITIVGNLCLLCWFWLPGLYLGDLIRTFFTKPKRRRKRRRTLDDMYG